MLSPIPHQSYKDPLLAEFARLADTAPSSSSKPVVSKPASVQHDWLPQLLDTREKLRQRSAEAVRFAVPLIYQDDEPVIWPRTINLIQGQTGSHKSRAAALFATVMIAAELPVCDTVGLTRHGEDTHTYTLCYVDTERNASDDFPFAIQQIRERAGYARDHHPDSFDYISLEPIPRAARLEALGQYLQHVRSKYDNHLIIVLDVLTDCIGSFNDEKESLLLVDMLNRFINSQDVTFICVIHENPGGMKARGHLGTEAQNKASTVLQVAYMKQANGESTDVIEMRYLKRRNGSPGLSFHVTYDEATKGLVRADAAAVAHATASRRAKATPEAMASALATALAYGPTSSGNLENKLAEQLGTGVRTIRDRLAELVATAAVLFDVSGRECQLTKAKDGKETRYALTPTAASP
jgi:hypothetical protein